MSEQEIDDPRRRAERLRRQRLRSQIERSIGSTLLGDVKTSLRTCSKVVPLIGSRRRIRGAQTRDPPRRLPCVQPGRSTAGSLPRRNSPGRPHVAFVATIDHPNADRGIRRCEPEQVQREQPAIRLIASSFSPRFVVLLVVVLKAQAVPRRHSDHPANDFGG